MRARRIVVPAVAIVATLLISLLGGCESPFTLAGLIDGPDGTPLTVSPASGTVVANNSIALLAAGGYPPYDYRIASGGGTLAGNVYTAPATPGQVRLVVSDEVGASVEVGFTIDAGAVGFGINPSSKTVFAGEIIDFDQIGGSGSVTYALTVNGTGVSSVDPASGVYTAGVNSGTDEVTVTDTVTLDTAVATITVEQRPFSISPSSITLTNNPPTNTIDFNPVGGNGPAKPPNVFTFDILPNNTGASIDAAGLYTAGAVAGVDTVRVTDSYDGRTRTATVTVVAASSVPDVDYEVSPVTGITTTDYKANVGFSADVTITNVGSVDGSVDATWAAYASPDGTIGGAGDVLLDSGVIAGGLVASDFSNITVAGNWPSVPGSYFILVGAQSAEDVVFANNVGTTAAPQYIATPVSISPTAFTIYTGQDITFSSTSEGAPAFTVDSDTSGGSLSGNVFTAGPNPGSAEIRVTDGDGSFAVATITVVATPAPATADYRVNAVTLGTVGTETGSTVDGDFDLENLGPANGGSTVSWTAYASSDPAVGPSDTIIDSGTTVALIATGTANVGFSGNWPDTAGNYFVVVAVSVSDDTTAANNTLDNGAATAITEPAPPPPLDVDYRVQSALPGGSYAPNDPLSEGFVIQNTGLDNGVENVSWSVYRSSDTTYGAGDALVDSGTIAGVPGSDVSGTITAIDTWPATTGTYYLIVRLQSDDDTDLSNNTSVSSPYVVFDAGVSDYVVSSVTADQSPIYTDSPILESFTVTNNGQNPGPSYDVHVMMSDDAMLGGDTPVESWTGRPSLASGVSVTYDISGLWPAAAGDAYLLVQVVATDDVTGNNLHAAGPYTVQDPPNYSVQATPPYVPAVYEGGFTGEAFDAIAPGHDLTIERVSGPVGNAPVTWRIFVSADAALDGGDAPLASGVVPAADITPFVTIPFPAGLALPATWGYYHVIVTVSAADDTDASDNTFVSARIPVWSPNASGETDTAEDDLLFEQADDFAVLLNPGDSIQIQGLVDQPGLRDSFLVQTGTAADGLGGDTTQLSIRLQWNTLDPGAGNENDLDLQVWATDASLVGESLDEPLGGPPHPENYQEPGDGSWLVLPGLTPGEVYYIDVVSFTAEDVGDDYTLFIQAGP